MFASPHRLESHERDLHAGQSANHIPDTDPLNLVATQLSFVMSEFYEANNRNPQSCDFAGNATVNKNAPSTIQDANAAASSCLSNPSATFTPSAPSTTPTSQQPGGSGSGGGGGSGGNNNNNGAASLVGGQQAVLGLIVATLFIVAGGVLTVF